MNKEFMDYLKSVAQERGIDTDTLIANLEEAVQFAAKKAVARNREMTVSFDRTSTEFKCKAKLFVVDTVSDLASEIPLKEARSVLPEAKVGDEIEWEVKTADFGRIAAQAAKQVFCQKTRQAEKANVCNMFSEQLMQLIYGQVRRVDKEGIVIGFPVNNGEMIVDGLLKRSERIPGETFDIGDYVTVLLIEINPSAAGASLYVSRSHPDFVRKLFEREVTEIAEGLVTIKGVSRDPGYRCKIAVQSNEPRIDPVGACVGVRGSRVKTIVRELGGEKVDIIEWSQDIRTYVTNALKPAALHSIRVDEDKHVIFVEVQEDQLSLAIGKKGQNARLASKLVDWKIDIKKVEVAQEENNDFQTQVRRAIEAIGAVDGIGLEAAEILVNNGYVALEGIVAATEEDLAQLPEFNSVRAATVLEAAKNALKQ